MNTIIPNKLYLGAYDSIFEVPLTSYIYEKHPVMITHVLNVTKDLPYYHQQCEVNALLQDASSTKTQGNVTYKRISIDDHESEDIGRHFVDAVRYIDQGDVVLVHCFAGVSRSASVVIAYMMYHKEWTYEEAYEYVKFKRPMVEPNQGFVRQLKEWYYLYDDLLCQ